MSAPETKTEGQTEPATTPPAAKTPPTPPPTPPPTQPEPPKPEKEEPKAEEAKEEKPSVTEFDSIAPEIASVSPGHTVILAQDEVQLDSKKAPGVECKIRPVKTRQLLAVGRILTGATRPLDLYSLLAPIAQAQNPAQQQAASIAAFANLVVTIPHSEREFIDLIIQLLDPVDELSEDDTNEFYTYMVNPEAGDTIKVFAQAWANEEPRMRDLGKMLIALFPQLRGEETTESEES